ncbi:MAG: selenide, water dikinase SelD [Clostridia bacterium]|nr:selenide, water dikinase SelD [Clostridia bacterium]
MPKKTDFRLSHMTVASGCAAKLGPGTLSTVLKDLPNVPNPDLMVGYDTSDDACVLRISDDLAIIQTCDFFTPMVDDPYTFGQIAATNALSDVYAMGGEPKLALSLLCVPNCLPLSMVHELLRGGHDKAVEAGCTIAGGHSISDEEPKYGLSVTGFVHPDKMLRNVGARPGDVLVLTKALGVGILTTSMKVDLVSEEDRDNLLKSMTTLNALAARAAQKAGNVHACTDVTGFGLFGHGYEMASGSDVTIRLHADRLPILNGAEELAKLGMLPAGAYRNRDHVESHVYRDPAVALSRYDLCCDPQTSGGLLIALPPENAETLLRLLEDSPTPHAIVGEVVEKGAYDIELVP